MRSEERREVRRLVVDPLVGALTSTVDANRDQNIRAGLTRLASIAQAHDVCVLAVRHLRKAAGGAAITAGSGSIGIIGVARAGFLVAAHPEQAETSVLASVKTNVGAAPPSLMFRKTSGAVDGPKSSSFDALRLEWLGESELTADELLKAPTTGAVAKAAESWLKATLEGGPMERVRRSSQRQAVDGTRHEERPARGVSNLGGRAVA